MATTLCCLQRSPSPVSRVPLKKTRMSCCYAKAPRCQRGAAVPPASDAAGTRMPAGVATKCPLVFGVCSHMQSAGLSAGGCPQGPCLKFLMPNFVISRLVGGRPMAAALRPARLAGGYPAIAHGVPPGCCHRCGSQVCFLHEICLFHKAGHAAAARSHCEGRRHRCRGDTLCLLHLIQISQQAERLMQQAALPFVSVQTLRFKMFE